MESGKSKHTADETAVVLTIVIIVAALGALFGWQLYVPSRWVVHIAPMQPSAAAVILLLSLALLVDLRLKSPTRMVLALSSSALVFCVASLFEALTPFNLGISQIFGNASALGSRYPSLIAPDAALSCSFIAVALLARTLHSERAGKSTYGILACAALLSAAALLAFAFDYESAIRISGPVRMPPHTAVGVLILAAIAVFTDQRSELTRERERYWRVGLGVFGFGLLFAVVVWASAVAHDISRIGRQLAFDGKIRTELVKDRVEQELAAVSALADVFSGVPAVNESDFSEISRALLKRNTGMVSIEWAPRVDNDQRSRFEAALRSEATGANFIQQPAARSALVRRDLADVYFPIELSTSDDSSGRYGFDIASDPLRLQAMEQSRRTNSLIATAPLQVMTAVGEQEIDFSVVLAIVRNTNADTTLQTVDGFLVGNFGAANLFEESLGVVLPDGLRVVVNDITAGQNPARLYYYHAVENQTLEGDSTSVLREQYHHRYTVEIAGRRWSIEYLPTERFLRSLRSRLPGLLLFFGVLATLLFNASVLFLLRQQSKTEAIVRERTAEVSLLYEGLEKIEIFRTLSMQAPVGIFQADAMGSVVFTNPEWEKIPARTSTELVGSGWTKAIHPEDVVDVLRMWQNSVKSAAPGSADFRLVRPNGDVRWVRRRWTPVFGQTHELVGFAGIDVDFTDQHSVDEALKIAAEAKTHFLANMSHEIRTPLTTILGFSEALRLNELSGEEQRRALDTIMRNGEHLLSLINDILDFSKIEAGRLPIELVDTAYVSVLENVVRSLSGKALDKGISLASEYVFPLPMTISVDPIRLQQILFNLVGNAVKFTEKGGVKVVVSYSSDVRELEFAVVDTGIGVAKEHIPRLFQVFEQGDYSRTKKFGGTGLGLAISQRLVGMMGGKIRVETRARCGSTFAVSFPVQTHNAEQFLSSVQQEAIASPQVETPRFNGHVLVVEDGQDNQLLLRFLLNRAGIDAEFAGNGKEGLDCSTKRDYDLILMDMQMPIMDGYTATELIRRQGKQVPIVAITAEATPEGRDSCLKSGCNEILTKPFTQNGFYKTLARYLRQNGESQATSGVVDDFAEICRSYWSRFPGRLAELAELYHSNDIAGVQRVAHKLKGARMFGSDEVGAVAAALEQAAKDGDLSAVGRELERLKASQPQTIPLVPII